ncbi:hypothetical protein JCM8097_006834 [Rhodosporidiobolus ruineniae]
MIPGGASEGTSTLIGVALAAGASILVAAGLSTQRLAHLRRQHKRDPPSNFPSSSSRSAETRSLRHPARSLPLDDNNEHTPLLRAPRPVLGRSASDPEPSKDNPQTLVPVISTTSPSPPSTIILDDGGPRLRRQRSRSSTRKPRTDKGYLRSKTWLLGFFLLNAGEFCNFLAYGFAPPSVVAPLGLVTLVANVFLAPAIVGEPFRKRDLIGVLVAVLGGATVVYSSRSSDKKPTPDEFLTAISRPLFIAYAIISLLLMLCLAYLSRTKYGDRFVLVDLSLCALAGAFTVLSTKAISSFINLNPVVAFKSWITYPVLLVLAGTAAVQVNFVNKSLQRFESRVVVPLQYCTFALSTILGSAVLYRDFDNIPFPSLLNFAFGCTVCGAGVYLLTRGPGTSSSPPSTTAGGTAPSLSVPSGGSSAPMDAASPAAGPPSLASPRGGSAKPLPFPSSPVLSAQGLPISRLLPVPVAAARGRKASLTLGSAYLLAGSPTGEGVFGEEDDGSGSGSEEEGEYGSVDARRREDEEESVGRGRRG